MTVSTVEFRFNLVLQVPIRCGTSFVMPIFTGGTFSFTSRSPQLTSRKLGFVRIQTAISSARISAVP